MNRFYLMFDTVAAGLDDYTGPLFGITIPRGGRVCTLIVSRKYRRGLEPVGWVGPQTTTSRVERAGNGWRIADGDVGWHVFVIRWSSDYSARLAGLLDAKTLAGKHVAVIGEGSVGGPMTLQFVRAGVGKVTGIDADMVALPNLVRSGFYADQLGMTKVAALAELAATINPLVEFNATQATFEAAIAKEPTLLDTVDLIVGAASDAVGFALAARYHRTVPLVLPALHANAASGEIFVSGGAAHAERACFSCFRARVGSMSSGRAWNYAAEGQELAAEPGLGADIGIIVSIATALSLNMLAGSPEKVIDFDRGQLLVISNRAGALFEAPYETRWVRVPRDPDCPNHAEREQLDPTEAAAILASIPEAT